MTADAAAEARGSVASALLLLVAAACGGGPTTPPARPAPVPQNAERLPAEPVLDEVDSGIEDAGRLLIDDAERWESFHRRAVGDRTPATEPPDVDFGRAVVVAAAMGRQPTGGHDVALEAVYLLGDTLYAEVLETSPGSGCVVTQALTAPLQAVRVPAPGAEVLVTVERSRIEECG